jgi:hypothetical protein
VAAQIGVALPLTRGRRRGGAADPRDEAEEAASLRSQATGPVARPAEEGTGGEAGRDGAGQG